MNENRTPDENLPSPDADTQRMPQQPTTASEQRTSAAPAKAPNRGRTLLIGAAALVAFLAVGGSAYAIGASMGDDDQDARPVAVTGQNHGTDPAADRDDSNQDGPTNDRPNGDSAPQRTSAVLPASDAASLRDAAEKAIKESGAKGATSIDVERGGYEIEVQLADGSERDLLIGVDGTIRIDADRDDADDRPDPLLDLNRLADIENAALAAATSAGGSNGVLESISSSDDRGIVYEIGIRLPDGREAEIELAADLTIVTVDLDD